MLADFLITASVCFSTILILAKTYHGFCTMWYYSLKYLGVQCKCFFEHHSVKINGKTLKSCKYKSS